MVKVQFASHLPGLSRLTQVRLDKKSCQAGQYPTKKSTLWPEVTSAKEIARRYAQLMHSNCASLNYVGIGNWVWQIITKHNSNPAIEPEIEFRELDQDEKSYMELFALEYFASQSGLPGTEKPPEPLSEEEIEHIEEIRKVEEAHRNGTLPGWLYD
jgi:hypothetical protein